MLKKIFFPLALVAICALVLSACGGASDNSTTSNGNAAPANKASTNAKATGTKEPTTTSSPTTTESGDKVGVPECDEYLAKMEACLSKVPAAAKAQYENTFEQTRKAWRETASTAQGKASLAAACKAANDSAKASMKSFNCEF